MSHADEYLEREAKKPGASEHAKIQWENRKLRRALENEFISCGNISHNILPGPWDEDLDKYHKKEYVVELEEGYKAILSRSPHLSWNGYVSLPNGHCELGRIVIYLILVKVIFRKLQWNLHLA